MNLAEEYAARNRVEPRAPEDRERPEAVHAEHRAEDDHDLELTPIMRADRERAGQLDRVEQYLRLIKEDHQVVQVTSPTRIETMSFIVGTTPVRICQQNVDREWVQISTADQPIWIGPTRDVAVSTAAAPDFNGGLRISNILTGPYVNTQAELWAVSTADTAVGVLSGYHG